MSLTDSSTEILFFNEFFFYTDAFRIKHFACERDLSLKENESLKQKTARKMFYSFIFLIFESINDKLKE